MSNETKPVANDPSHSSSQKNVKTAFVQVPIGIREQVEDYIKELMQSSDLDFDISNENINELPAQGCFLVISLTKIEEIVNHLKTCLSMEPDESAANIKSEIRQTLTLLS